ncbi:MAG: immunoglobulin domain-containing protein [Proteobacteria bacterium]|nr:immunoglobulin domain-containing protein [Pseudomonadota bacterium]
MQRMRAHLLAITVVLTTLVLSACGQVGTTGAPTDTGSDAVAPTITAQPASQTVVSGASVNFTVAATGTEPLSYQWSRNGSLIEGAVAPTFSTVATDSDDGATYTVVVTNAVGSAQSAAATLTVAATQTAPVITTQPADQSVTAGQTATFSVVATGTPPLTYQWSKNGVAIAGATSPTYTTPATTTADNGALFSVVVSNADDATTSRSATLGVLSSSGGAVAPTISTQPSDQSITVGKTATFTVVAAGSAPLAYQWQKNGTPISGATGTSYTTPAETTTDSGATFSVVVSNSAGNVASRAAILTVTAVAPTITTQPADTTVTAGKTATFAVVAAGTAPLSYQWKKNGTAIGGATAASYTTPSETTADNGATFQVTVSNSAGAVTSRSAVLTVNAAPTAPTITTQPADATITAGATATFTVVAAGTAPLTYQWRKNGTAIGGATAASYTTPAETTADNGATFQVTITNSAGNITSRSALLTVNAAATAPTITTQPSNQSVQAGQAATFSVVATGTAPLSYQWRKNGTAIAGATSAVYTTAAETAADNGAVFAVVVSNAVGSVTSSNATLTVTPASPGTDVVTYKNDHSRTGQNLTETQLTTANVNSATFGKLRFLTTTGKVDAQPLYLSGLTINGVSHNVLFVATEAGLMYAFDVNTGTQLWQVSLIPSGETASGPVNCDEITPNIGITSTPVIDRSAGAHGTIYVVAMSVAGTTYHQRLHALDVTTGAELLGGPTSITASYTASSGTITFDPQQYVSKTGLLLLNGTIYIGWTSHCDNKFYTGWLMGYSETTLKQTAVLNVAPNSGGQGPAIWMAGGGLAADSAGYIYFLTANGVFETTLDSNGFPNMADYGNAFVKVSTSGGTLTVSDYFSPSNTAFLSSNDLDLGSGGILLLPDMTDSGGTTRHLAVGAGKDGNIYVVNRDSMGHFSSSANNIWQQLNGVLGNRGTNLTSGTGGVWSTPAYFNGHVYYCANGGLLESFSVTQAKLASSPGSFSAQAFNYPGCAPSVSANGTGNGIIWAHMNTNPAVLYAYSANNLGTLLYSSAQAAGNRDQLGQGNKWVVPTVADGKVFVGQTNGVAVFGLLN